VAFTIILFSMCCDDCTHSPWSHSLTIVKFSLEAELRSDKSEELAKRFAVASALVGSGTAAVSVIFRIPLVVATTVD
jgi:hypothetical protein